MTFTVKHIPRRRSAPVEPKGAGKMEMLVATVGLLGTFLLGMAVQGNRNEEKNNTHLR